MQLVNREAKPGEWVQITKCLYMVGRRMTPSAIGTKHQVVHVSDSGKCVGIKTFPPEFYLGTTLLYHEEYVVMEGYTPGSNCFNPFKFDTEISTPKCINCLWCDIRFKYVDHIHTADVWMCTRDSISEEVDPNHICVRWEGKKE